MGRMGHEVSEVYKDKYISEHNRRPYHPEAEPQDGCGHMLQGVICCVVRKSYVE